MNDLHQDNPRLIEYEHRIDMFKLRVPGFRTRFFLKRDNAVRTLGRYVRRFGAWWLERSVI